MFTLPETGLIKAGYTSSQDNMTTFIVEPLLPGYGMTIGNALRRVLLSSLAGAAVTAVKIDGATHEFSTLKGVKEDMVDLILNLKTLKVQLHGDEPTLVKLNKKGPGEVKVQDFGKNSQVVFTDPNYVIAHLDNSGSLNLEITVEKGRGYLPTERRKDEKSPLGTIAVDAIFTPIKRVHYEVENTRVGGMTNYDKLIIDITTDGTIDPQEAMDTAINIILDHFSYVKDQLISVKESRKTVSKKITQEKVKLPKKEKLIKADKKPVVKKTVTKSDKTK